MHVRFKLGKRTLIVKNSSSVWQPKESRTSKLQYETLILIPHLRRRRRRRLWEAQNSRLFTSFIIPTRIYFPGTADFPQPARTRVTPNIPFTFSLPGELYSFSFSFLSFLFHPQPLQTVWNDYVSSEETHLITLFTCSIPSFIRFLFIYTFRVLIRFKSGYVSTFFSSVIFLCTYRRKDFAHWS